MIAYSPASNRRVSDGSPPYVVVVILNWRHAAETVDCALSVLNSRVDRFDVIICDNDSGDGSLERIHSRLAESISAINEQRRQQDWRRFILIKPEQNDHKKQLNAGCNHISLIQTGRNGGYAFGNNVGIRRMLAQPDADFVWVLNNDTIVDPGALRALTAKMAADPTIGICGARILYLEKPTIVQSLGGGRFLKLRARGELIGLGESADQPRTESDIEGQLDFVNGAAAFVSRRFLEQVGLMDEGYFLYWEENDWAARMMRAKGFRLGYSDQAIVYHHIGLASGSDADLPSPSSSYWMVRSFIRFLWRFQRRLLPFAYVMQIRRALVMMSKGHRHQAIAMLRGLCRAAPPA